jgi:leucyl-tRNA---protein transferase
MAAMGTHPPSVQALIGAHSVPLGLHSHPCSYLPGRVATEEAWLAWQVKPDAYHALMDRGFRRSGSILYRTACTTCRRCVPIRVPVAEFKPGKSQRRALRRNADLSTHVSKPHLTAEKHDIYRRYLYAQHRKSPQGADIESLREFLYTSCVDSIEIEYRNRFGRLIGVSICDVSRQSLSSVYHFFDPGEAWRSLGVFSVLQEIELCRAWGVPHYYLGYWVEGCPSMDYKRRYQPHELLINGQWQTGN